MECWIYGAATLTCGWMKCPKKGKVLALQLIRISLPAFPRSLSDPFSTPQGRQWVPSGGGGCPVDL